MVGIVFKANSISVNFSSFIWGRLIITLPFN
ncbi:hypothetical protein EMIT0194P_130108 [Pseudomonas serbica]